MEGEFKDLSRLIARMFAERWVEAARKQGKNQPHDLPTRRGKHKESKNKKPSSKNDRRES